MKTDDDDNKHFDEKSQLTIDLLIEQMKIDVNKYPPIITTNLETSGENAKLRQQEKKKKIKELENFIKSEKQRKENEEKERQRLKKEIEKIKKDNEERKMKEKELKEIERKQEEERIRLKQIQEEARKKEEENRKREEAIRKIAEEHKIDIQRLDNVIDGAGIVAAGGGIGVGLGILAMIGGAALTCICPVAGPIVFSAGFGAATAGTAEAAISGAVAGITKVIKTIKE